MQSNGQSKGASERVRRAAASCGFQAEPRAEPGSRAIRTEEGPREVLSEQRAEDS